MLDQMVSSATNFAATLTAARLLGPAGLGKVALAVAIAYGGMNFTRGVIGESLLVFQRDRIVNGALTTALLVGSVLSLAGLAIGALFRPSDLALFGALAVLLPLLTFQDTTRYVFFRRKRPDRALTSDIVWAIAQGLAFLVIVRTHKESPFWVLSTWGAGIVASAIYGVVVLRPSIRLHYFTMWFNVSRRLSAWVAAQSVLAQTAQQVLFVAIGLFVSLSVLGVMRAAQTLIGPFTLFLAVFRVVSLSELGRTTLTSTHLRSAARRTSLAALGLASVCAIILLAGRATIVGRVFGESFSKYHGIAIPLAITVLAYGVSVGAEVGNRAAAAGRNVFATQLTATLMGVPLIVGLAAVAGPVGAVWGMCLQRVVWATVAWTTFLMTSRRFPPVVLRPDSPPQTSLPTRDDRDGARLGAT